MIGGFESYQSGHGREPTTPPTVEDRTAPGSTIYGVITQQAPRPGSRHRKKLGHRRLMRATLAIAAAIGLAVIVAITVPAFFGAASPQHGGKPIPTVTVRVRAPRPIATVTVFRPGPTITVTELQPGPTVTVQCRHPGRGCGGG